MRRNSLLKACLFSIAGLAPLANAAQPPKAAKPAPVKEASSTVVTLGAIDGENDGKLSVINIRLSGKPAWSKLGEVQNHGSFLQLTLPETLVPEPGRFFDGNNPHISKIAVFQVSPEDAGIRLFVNHDAAAVKQALSAELLGNRVVITVDQAKLPVLAAKPAAPASDVVGPPIEAASDDVIKAAQAAAVVARTEVRHDIPAPSELLKNQDKEAAHSASGVDIRGKLVQVAMFSAIMLTLMAMGWLVRPILRKRAEAKGALEPLISMKTLATMAVAGRQKISLIQVGDERILIGVTPENVTFLTAIGRQNHSPLRNAEAEAAPRFSQMLASKRPATVDLVQAPVLKKLEGNDEESLREKPLPPAAREAETSQPTAKTSPAEANRPKKAAVGNRVNIAVGEDGIKNLGPRKDETRRATAKSAPKPSTETGPDGQRAIDDVTRMIREKLKALRTI